MPTSPVPDNITGNIQASAANRLIGKVVQSRAFSWLKAPTSAFTFKTLLRHYAKPGVDPPTVSRREIGTPMQRS